ncbi:MAG: hemerythrin family protein [Magnetococcales bacterium]|nr:hemerythrin family protein [Magnetococcales bacterium]
MTLSSSITINDPDIQDFRTRLFARLRTIHVPQLQREHEGLIEIIVTLYVCVKKMQRSRPTPTEEQALDDTLNHLKSYATQHFSREEAFMEKIGFEGLNKHKEAHRQFVAGLLAIEDKMRSTSSVYVIDLLHKTVSWLFDHINSQDMQYSRFSQGLPPRSFDKAPLPKKNPKEIPALRHAGISKKSYREKLLQRLQDVGVARFNLEHRELLNQISGFHELTEALSNRKPSADDWQRIDKTLTFLSNYTKSHFGAEESLMRRHSYPGLEAHVQEHQSFIDKFTEFKSKLLEEREIFYAVDLVFYLLEWFFSHTSRTDTKYKAFFRGKALED